VSKLPTVSGRECVRALEKAGFQFVSQSGSHMKLRRVKPFAQIIVPNHKELAVGTLRSILRQAGLTVNEFVDLL
jgi:predicted RNA binding protein YcfA (HicA-like mRNA interferase family)